MIARGDGSDGAKQVKMPNRASFLASMNLDGDGNAQNDIDVVVGRRWSDDVSGEGNSSWQLAAGKWRWGNELIELSNVWWFKVKAIRT